MSNEALTFNSGPKKEIDPIIMIEINQILNLIEALVPRFEEITISIDPLKTLSIEELKQIDSDKIKAEFSDLQKKYSDVEKYSLVNLLILRLSKNKS